MKTNPETSSTGVRSENIQNQRKNIELVKETGTAQRTSSTSTEHHEPVRKNTNTKQTKLTELMKETGAVQKTPSTKKKHNEPVQKSNSTAKKNTLKDKKLKEEKEIKIMKGFWKSYAEKCKNERKVLALRSEANLLVKNIHENNLTENVNRSQINQDQDILPGQPEQLENYQQDKSETSD